MSGQIHPNYGSITILNALEAAKEPSQDKSTCQWVSPFNCFFYLCYFLSGQYHVNTSNDNRILVELDETSRHKYKWKKILSMTVAVIQAIMCAGFVAINVTHVTLNVIVEVCQIMNITCSPGVFENEEVNCTLPYRYWKISTTILVSTIAEMASYILMTIILYQIYGYFCKFFCKPNSFICKVCCCAPVQKALEQNKSFTPFDDSCTCNKCHQKSSTALTPEHAKWFFPHYLSCMLIFVCSLITIAYEG